MKVQKNQDIVFFYIYFFSELKQNFIFKWFQT